MGGELAGRFLAGGLRVVGYDVRDECRQRLAERGGEAVGSVRAVFAEGVAFARRCGLDLPAVLDILRSGAAYSRVMDAKGAKMIAGDFTTEAKLAQHLKDVRLILETGSRCGAALPLSHLHEQLLSDLVARGLGECDNSCVIRAFDGEGGSP